MKNTKQLKNAAYNAAYEIISSSYFFEGTKILAMKVAKDTGYRYWYSQYLKAYYDCRRENAS